MPAAVELVALDFRRIAGLIRGKTELFIFLSTGSEASGVLIGRAFETAEWPATNECLAMGGSGAPWIPGHPAGVFVYFRFDTPLTADARVLALNVCQNDIVRIESAYVHHNDTYHPIPLWDGEIGAVEVRRLPVPPTFDAATELARRAVKQSQA